NQGILAGRQVSADALMISLNRRLSRIPELTVDGAGGFTNGHFRLRLAGNVGQRLRVESSTNLTSWVSLGVVTLTNSVATYLDPSSATSGQRFYRAALAP